MEKLLVTPHEAAALIGIGRTRIYDMIARGAIPSVRIGRSVRVPLDALREWVSAHELRGHYEGEPTAPKPPPMLSGGSSAGEARRNHAGSRWTTRSQQQAEKKSGPP